MPRLTLRTLLAYIDDTLEADQARSLGRKVAESDEAKHLIERIKKVTRRRGLRTPVPDGSDDDVADPNTVAAYLSDNLDSEQLKQLESTCLESDVHGSFTVHSIPCCCPICPRIFNILLCVVENEALLSDVVVFFIIDFHC